MTPRMERIRARIFILLKNSGYIENADDLYKIDVSHKYTAPTGNLILFKHEPVGVILGGSNWLILTSGDKLLVGEIDPRYEKIKKDALGFWRVSQETVQKRREYYRAKPY